MSHYIDYDLTLSKNSWCSS